MVSEIRIQPHHAPYILMRNVWKSNVDRVATFYDEEMRTKFLELSDSINEGDVKLRVVSNEPDSICDHCPINPNAQNYNPDMDQSNCWMHSRAYDPNYFWANALNLEDINGETIPSREFTRRITNYRKERIGEILTRLQLIEG